MSDVQRFYSGATVFVTGATGFLGKLVVEKLLRSCDVKRIYILVRLKKNKTIEERFKEYFNGPEYALLKQTKPASLGKLSMIQGDCTVPDLGLTSADREKIISEVSCIFHCAATVRFDEKLKTAVHINVRATRDLIRIAHSVRNLKSFVHVSTAYSFCPKREIDECFYEPKMSPENLIQLVEILDDATLDSAQPGIIGPWPNTYAFTKSIAEDVIRSAGAKLPIAMVRPSIVVGSLKEPLPGWAMHLSGPQGLYIAMVLGFVHTMQFEPAAKADQVPADFVVNCTLVAGHQAALGASKVEPMIYNVVSGARNPLTWRENMNLSNDVFKDIPSMMQMWHSFVFMIRSSTLNLILHYLLHIAPAYIMDTILSCIGKKPRLLKMYKKYEKVMDVLAYFTTNNWTFKDTNTQQLWDKLHVKDKEVFDFDITSVTWKEIASVAVPGLRIYLLKDPLETVPKAIARRFKLKVAHYFILTLLSLVLLKLLMYIFF